jgi:hypothetical protein
MPGRRVSHSESRWAQLPETVIRCNGTRQSGKRCRREAIEGSVVCEIHGGLAPQVRRRAAERVLLTADEAIQVIKSFISDPTVPAGVRLKAAQDLADRAGLAAAQIHKIVPSTEDPLIAFFEGAFSDPSALMDTSPADPAQPAIEAYVVDPAEPDAEPEESLEAELIDDAEPGDDTPARVAQMIKAGVFDRRPGK